MKCNICKIEGAYKTYTLKEMMFGFKDTFTYFECDNCGCFQIENIPANMEKYYPANYYSFKQDDNKPLQPNYFKGLQFDQISGYHKSILGGIVSFNYVSAPYHWFKFLQVDKTKAKVLDIGCGHGDLLKKLFLAGFKNLTGTDPYIEKDISYNSQLNIYKKDLLEVAEKFDIIMMHHSLEHMHNQHEVIEKLAQILNPDGKILIRIPIMSDYLFDKYGPDLISLDPPRHFFIHSLKSIKLLLEQYGFTIYKTEFDAEVTEFIASEQYKMDIPLNDPKSYFTNRNNDIFSKEQVEKFKTEINELNAQGKSSLGVFYVKRKS